MALIRKIINWIKSLFNKIFKRKKKNKKVGKNKQLINSRKNVSKNYSHNDDMPGYMIISNTEKEKLLYSISLMKNVLIENRCNVKEKEINDIINSLKSNSKINRELFSEIADDTDKLLSSKYLELLIKGFEVEERNSILLKHESIINGEKDFKVYLEKIDDVIAQINKNRISIIEENEINNEISNIINDKKLDSNIKEKVNTFNKNIYSIIESIDDDFLSNVYKEYNKINYITISTLIVDKNYEKFKKLEDDFKSHRYNKYYYEREISKIKHELNQIKALKNRKDISNNINELKKEFYTKSKDKYDILYNNEIFMNMEKECDNLLEKINTKVIDIKKEKEEINKEDNDKKNEYIKNILKRFRDMELARRIILLMQEDKIDDKKIVDYINKSYIKFSDGLNNDFNFERNKYKTELVVLYNDLNKSISMLKKEPYITADHINFKMDDLIEASKVKKDELNLLLKRNNLECDDTLVDEKIESLIEKGYYKKSSHVLKKSDK